MRTGRAKRLARRADRLRADGSRGRRARRAMANLTAAAGRSDTTAAAALRETWLANPREVTWPDAARWCSTVDVLAAAVDPRRTAAARAALGVFCHRHDLVPDNDIERALFFVLTGQHERYEALDPDGTLLATGYRGASDATKTALRQTMLDLGAVSAVRVIADRPDRTLTMAEGDYLATQLANARDWERLWRLIPTIPLAGAARAAKLFGDWRPPDDAGRRLLSWLAATDQNVIGTLSNAAATRLRISNPLRFSFAPDGSQLAVRNAKGTRVFEPHTGRVQADHPAPVQRDVHALGAGEIVYQDARFAIIRSTPWDPNVLLTNGPVAAMGPTADGLVLSHDGHLEFHTAHQPRRRVPLGALDLGPGGKARHLSASDPTSGQLVLSACWDGGDVELALLDAGLNLLARLPGNRYPNTAFCGPDRLVRWRWDTIRAIESWRRDGATFTRTASLNINDVSMEPVAVPARGQVVVRRRTGLVWLDAETLTEVDGPPGLPAVDARVLAFSRDGTLAAIAPPGAGVVVYDLGLCALTALFDTSLARMSPADLATVAAHERRAVVPPAAIGVLSAALAYRFGADVALGTNATPGIRPDDIALGGG